MVDSDEAANFTVLAAAAAFLSKMFNELHKPLEAKLMTILEPM